MNLKRIIAVLLIFSIILTGCIGTNVKAAQEDSNAIDQEVNKENEYAPVKTDKIVREKEKKSERTKYSTTYRLSNGQYETEIYNNAIRYKDKKSGKLLDYDASLSLLENNADLKAYKYENKSGDKKNYFPKKLKESTPVITEYNDCKISVVPVDSNISKVSLDDEIHTQDLYGDEQEASYSVTYSNVKENTDINITSLEDGIKENIILNEKPVSNIFDYYIEVQGCYPKLDVSSSEDKYATTVSFYNKKNDEKIACIPEAFMTDSSLDGAYNNDCHYTLKKQSKGKYILSLTVSKEYLDDDSRVYPVTIDPTITWTSSTYLKNTYVAAGRQCMANYSSSANLVVGRYQNEYNYSYIGFPYLYSYSKSKSVYSAKLRLTETSETNAGKRVNMFKVNGDWEANTLTYDARPSTDSSVYKSFTTTGINGKILDINLDAYVSELREGTENFSQRGFMLAQADGSTDIKNAAVFYSQRASNTNFRPKLFITYYDNPTKADTFIVSPYNKATGKNIAIAYSGVESQILSHVQYKVEKYDDSTKSITGSFIPYSSNTIIGTKSSGSSIIDTSTWTEGCYKISIRGVDTYSNYSTESSQILHLDFTKPKAYYSCFSFSDTANSPRKYSSEPPVVIWKDIEEAHIDSVEMKINNNNFYEIGNSTRGSFSVPVTQISSGVNTIQYRVKDIAGNISDIITTAFYYDNEMPVIDASLSKETSENDYCNESDIKLTYNITDNNPYMVQYSINGEEYNTFAYYVTDGSIELPDYFYAGDEGKKIVKVRAVDLAGNTSNEVELHYYYDGTPPDFDADIDPASSPHSYALDIPRVNYTVSDYAYKQLEIRLGNTNHVVGTIQNEGSIKLPPDWFTDTGVYELVVTAEDKAGNKTTRSLYYFYINSSISATDYIPENVTINERMDGSAEIIWNRLYDNALPSDISYSVYASDNADFIPSIDNLVQAGIKQNRVVIPKRSEGHYYYKICAKKSFPSGADNEVSDYVTVETDAVSAEELTKRIGIDDKYGYVNFLTPCGTGKIERSKGNYNYIQTDYSIPCGKLSFDLTRVYNSQSNKNGVLGTGWTSWYQMQAYESDNNIILEDGDGSCLIYVNDGNGKYSSERDEKSYFTKVTDSDEYSYRQVYKDGTIYTYNNYGYLVKIQEVNGSYLELIYDYHNRVVERIISHSKSEESGEQSVHEARFIYSFTNYNNKMRLIGIMLPNGAILAYSHSGDKLMKVKITGENGIGEISYNYEYQNGQLVKVYDAKKTGVYNIQYSNDRVSKCIYPDGTYVQMDYSDSSNESSYSKKTLQNNEISSGYEVYDDNGYVIRMLDRSGASEGTLHSYQYEGHKMTGSMETVSYQKLVNGVVTDYQKSIGDTFEYERNGNVTRIEYEDGSIITYVYDLNGEITKNLPTSITKEEGEDTLFKYNLEYNDNGNVTKIEDEINKGVITIIYDDNGNATNKQNSRKQEDESIINTEYDNAGNPVKETVKSGTVDTTTNYSYDNMGRVVTETNGKTNTVITHSYDSLGREIQTVEKVGGKVRVSQYEYDVNGCLIKETTPEGAVNTYEYDTMNRVIQHNVTADGKTTSTYTTYEYADVDILTGKSGRDAIKTVKNTLCTTEKDENNVILSKLYTDGNGLTVRNISQGVCTDYIYDGRGNIISEYIHGQSDSSGILNAYVYDKDGYCTAKLIGAKWNSYGKLTVSDKTSVTTMVYDALGNIISETDGEGNVTGYGYTEDRKLSEVVLPGASGISRRYTYDEKTSDGNFADRTYDSNNHMSEVVSNASGQVLYTADYGDGNEQIKTSYEYDSLGNVIRQNNGNESFILFSYDDKGQCIRKQGISLSEIKQTDTFYEYDEHGNVICIKDYVVDESTNMYVMQPLCNTYYEYNEKGLLTAEGQIMYNAEPTKEQIHDCLIHYSYDIHDNLVKITYPDGIGEISEEHIEYNDNLQISDVKAVLKGETTERMLREYTYFERGMINNMRENTAFASDDEEHWITKEYLYDPLDRVAGIQYTDDTGIFEKYSYEYDRNSNITHEILQRGDNTEIRSHEYTVRGQLSDTNISVNGVAEQPYHYTYDEEGNRTSVQNGYTTTYEYNGLNQMTKQTVQLYGGIVTNYVYDKSGNQTRENADTEGNKKLYRYDPFNRLVSVEKKTGNADYVTMQKNYYNGDDARVYSCTGNTETDYFYQQGKLSYTVNEADNSISRYLYGGNNGVIVREESSNCCFYTKDIKGSTMSLLSETGEPLVTYDYDDYGITKRKTAAANTSGIGIDNEICYSGGVYDKETSLYYLNARYYSPYRGVFLTQDSYRGTLDDEITWNLYAYCANNPVNYVDPSGHTAIAAVGAGAALASNPVGWIILGIGIIATVSVAGLIYVIDNQDSIGGFDYVFQPFEEPVNPFISTTTSSTVEQIGNIFQAKKKNQKYDPDPFKRPGQKKQNRENKYKNRKKDNYSPRNNKRNNQPAKPKHHTPAKEHRKVKKKQKKK